MSLLNPSRPYISPKGSPRNTILHGSLHATILDKSDEKFVFYSPAKPKTGKMAADKKLLDLDPFVSHVFKQVPEVFMCHGYEEFYD